MIFINSYCEGWLEGQQWWESFTFQGKMLLSQWSLWKHLDRELLLTLPVWEAPLTCHFIEIWLLTGAQFWNIRLSFTSYRALEGCEVVRRWLFACCHCQLKGLGNGNIGGHLLKKTRNICNLAAFLPDSRPQQWTMVSRCSHELWPMESLLTSLHLGSPRTLPAATKPICFLPKFQQEKAVPPCRWQEDDEEIHKARKAPWPWILAICSQGVTNPLCKESGQTSRKKLTFELPGINWARYSRSRKDYWPQCLASRPHFFLSLFVWSLYWRRLWDKSRAFMQMLWCRVCGVVLRMSQGWGIY